MLQQIVLLFQGQSSSLFSWKNFQKLGKNSKSRKICKKGEINFEDVFMVIEKTQYKIDSIGLKDTSCDNEEDYQGMEQPPGTYELVDMNNTIVSLKVYDK